VSFAFLSVSLMPRIRAIVAAAYPKHGLECVQLGRDGTGYNGDTGERRCDREPSGVTCGASLVADQMASGALFRDLLVAEAAATETFMHSIGQKVAGPQ
jgi:hypothetical protein